MKCKKNQEKELVILREGQNSIQEGQKTMIENVSALRETTRVWNDSIMNYMHFFADIIQNGSGFSVIQAENMKDLYLNQIELKNEQQEAHNEFVKKWKEKIDEL